MKLYYSFVSKKTDCKTLELLQTETTTTSTTPAVKFKILKTSLSANNKFYLAFGDKAPFHFFKCYPVEEGSSKLVAANEGSGSDDTTLTDYVHPPVWGLCEVIESKLEDVPVGTVYRAMLPMGTHVQFEDAHVEPKLGNLVIHRPTTNPAYNEFTIIPATSVCHPTTSTNSSDLALACFPGIVTGFGLRHALQHADFYGGCDTIVVTSASSKVALAFALYMKDVAGKKIIGYTSDANKSFCESTGLYSSILGYNDTLPEECQAVIMIEISGQAATYTQNAAKVKKLLCIGNASGAPDKDSSFAYFTLYATIKLMLTMVGAPKFLRSRMNPTQELFLIMDTVQVLQEEWGKDKYLQTLEDHVKIFCDAAKQWIQVRNCDKEGTIQAAFENIEQGKVPPSECIVLDVAKAVVHRM